MNGPSLERFEILANAGYQTAIDCARQQGLNLPMVL